LTKDHRVNVEQTRELVELAKPLPVTYHRAFDESADLHRALEDVIQSGAKRILTSGGAKSALEGAAVVAELIEAAGERIVIVPGAGITGVNITEVARRTRTHEFHSGLSAAFPYGSKDYRKFEDEVRKLAKQIARMSGIQTTPIMKRDF
jgi:copper homeostasis protein